MRPRAVFALASATLMALMSLAAGPVAHAVNLGPYPSGGPDAPTPVPVDFGPQTVGTTTTVSVDLMITSGYTFRDNYSGFGGWVPDPPTARSVFRMDPGTCDDAAGPTVCTVHVSFTPTTAQPFALIMSKWESNGSGFHPNWTFPVRGTGVPAVAHDVSPFSQPVDNLPTLNIAKAGSTVPLKFKVTDSTGGPVTDLTAADVEVTSTQGGDGCGTDAGTDSIETYVASSGLQNLGGGPYQFNWATPKSYKNQCRIMTVTAGGGTRSAAFQFK